MARAVVAAVVARGLGEQLRDHLAAVAVALVVVVQPPKQHQQLSQQLPRLVSVRAALLRARPQPWLQVVWLALNDPYNDFQLRAILLLLLLTVALG